MNILEPLLILNANSFEPVDYVPRPTAKAVILNEKNEILLFPNFLIGGGVDEGETFEEALRRECIEEAGVSINIIQPLGMVIQYRDGIKKKYQVRAFLTKKVGDMVPRTTTQENEQDRHPNWKTFENAVEYLQAFIEDLENSQEDKNKDSYQGPLYNAKTHLFFIKKAQQILGL